MSVVVTEVADGLFRIANHQEAIDFTLCQYLLDGPEPLLFHTGPVQVADQTLAAIGEVSDPSRLRWLSWGHAENDECGAAERVLAAAPRAEVLLGPIGAMLWMGELGGRPIRQVTPAAAIDLGGRVVRWVDTPHVPHAWDAGLLFDESTATLLCGDLFTRMGAYPAVTDEDPVGPAMAAEDAFPGGTALTAELAPTIRALADLGPRRLAPMHAPVYEGGGPTDAARALEALAAAYEERVRATFGPS